MKRSTLLTLSVVTLVALQAAPALAGKKSRNNNQNQDQQQDQQQNQQRKFNVQSLLNGQPDWQGMFKKHKHHQDESPVTPLDPGRGDGRVPVAEPITPPRRPGFVWVKDHWERARTPKLIVDPVTTQDGPVVRDHRDGLGSNGGVTVTTQGGPIVRDHRSSATIFNPNGGKVWTAGTTVRDHRTITPPPLSNGQGGVTVTTTPGGGKRDNAITGSGPNPLDLLAEGAAKVGNVFGIGYGEVTSGDGSAPSGPTVRDHRTAGPVVRDHRTGQ